MPDPIDLRSDTVTRPTGQMRKAMAAAEVGDDVYGEDPTVAALQDEVAALFGRDAALFVPSGVMANQVALRVWADAGTEVVVEADAHVVDYESGAGALLAGVQYRMLPTADGLLSAQQVADAIRPDAYHLTPTSLVMLEQTHNRKGGTPYPADLLRAIREVADRHGLPVYIDGARSLNAAVATGTPPTVYGEVADGLMLSLSKGLGAPVGSVLAGDADAIAEASVWRPRYGGAMRQSGVIAAAGLYALRNHVERLAEDHSNAAVIAETVAADVPDAVDPGRVLTNIVYVDTGPVDAGGLADDLADGGILVAVFDPRTLRLVTHLDVTTADCRRAARAIVAALT